MAIFDNFNQRAVDGSIPVLRSFLDCCPLSNLGDQKFLMIFNLLNQMPVLAKRIKRSSGLSKDTVSTMTNLAMLASLVTLLAGPRKTHRSAGKMFLGLLAAHLFLYRKKLLRDLGKVLP